MGKRKSRAKAKSRNASKLTMNAQSSAESEMMENSLDNTSELDAVSNDLRGALGLSSVGTQLSQVDTLFKNNRWYLVSNMRQLLSQLYVEIGLIKTVVDIPVEDGLRGGVNITTKQLDEEQLAELNTRMAQQDDLETFSAASKWNRLFGGAAVLIMTDQDPKTPLDWDNIGENTNVEFRDLDMWELYYSRMNTQDYSSVIDEKSLDNVETFDYYGIPVHKSRVLLLRGIRAPSFVRPRLRGWGVSIIETLVRSMNQYLKSTDLAFEVLDEFKIDIFKIKGLAMAMTQKGGDEKIRNRISLANEQKNYQNALVVDGEDDYQQKQVSFAGLSDVMTGIRMQVASDVRMPLTKLFGISASGFSSGEDDIENYNASIESGVRSKGKPILLSMIKIRCQQMFGFVPDDLDFEYESLRVLSSVDQESVKDSQFSRLLETRQAGECSSLEFREAVNKNKLLPLALDTQGVDDKLGETTPDIEKNGNPLSNSYNDTPENMKGITKVAVVGIMSGDEILRGKRRDNKKWTCPAGHLEKDEDPKDGAIRETFEESGIRLLKSDLKEVCKKILISEKTGEKIALFAYEAKIPKQKATSENDPDKEVSEWKWVKCDRTSIEMSYDTAHAGHNDVFIQKMMSTKKDRKYLPNFGM